MSNNLTTSTVLSLKRFVVLIKVSSFIWSREKLDDVNRNGVHACFMCVECVRTTK